MSMVRVVALEPVNGRQPGDDFEVTEREAGLLVRRNLVKMAVGSRNKMLKEPANKANPSPAAGSERQSSASPAAPASRKTTARPSGSGTPARKTAADE